MNSVLLFVLSLQFSSCRDKYMLYPQLLWISSPDVLIMRSIRSFPSFSSTSFLILTAESSRDLLQLINLICFSVGISAKLRGISSSIAYTLL
uniref:Putative ovule protein n=1 Tax=Solanum chacoense TaxID=4108 RepID=A0A0V0HLP8_SOLCH